MKAELQTDKPWYARFWRKSAQTPKAESAEGLVEAKRETLVPSTSTALVVVEKPAEKKGWSSAETSSTGGENKVSLASVEPPGFFGSAPVRKAEILSTSVRAVERPVERPVERRVERKEESIRSEYDWDWESPSSYRREPPKPSKSATQLKIEREKLTIPDSFPDSLSVENYDAAERLAKYAQRSAPSLAFADALSDALAGYRPSEDSALKRAKEKGPGSFELPDVSKSPEGTAAAVAQKLKGFSAVSPEVKRVLVNAVAYTHGSAEEPLVGATSALDAAAALSAMKPEQSAAFGSLLQGAKSDVERALLLEALAFRSTDVVHGDEARSGRAMKELETFAGLIRGASAQFLVERSTTLHSNEGLKQAFGNSCAGAAAMNCLSAADPYLAFVLNTDSKSYVQSTLEKAMVGLDRSGDRGVTWDFVGRGYRSTMSFTDKVKDSSLTPEEKKALTSLLEMSSYSSSSSSLSSLSSSRSSYGSYSSYLSSSSSLSSSTPGPVKKKLEAMGIESTSRIIARSDWDQVEQLIARANKEFPEAAKALARLKRLSGGKLPEGFGSVGEIVRGTIEGDQRPAGVGPDHISNTYVTPLTHMGYERTKYLYRLEGDPFHSERLAQIILSGQKVPLRRGDPEDLPENYSHAITAYGVRGPKGDRQFYVVDGSGRWINQAEFEAPDSRISYFFGDSHPPTGVGRKAKGRPEL